MNIKLSLFFILIVSPAVFAAIAGHSYSGAVSVKQMPDSAQQLITSARPVVVSTGTIVYPQLIWEKKSEMPVGDIALSRDGSKSAISYSLGAGYFVVYDHTGKELWEFNVQNYVETVHGKQYKGKGVLVSISDTGQFLIASIGISKGDGPQEYKKICLDGDSGKVLWEITLAGSPIFGGDTYIVVRSPIDDNAFLDIGGDYDMTIFYASYYLFNMKGHILFSGRMNASDYIGFSEDLKYLYAGDTIRDIGTGSVLWQQKGARVRQIYKGRVLVEQNNKEHVFDLITGQQLLEKEASDVARFITNSYFASMNHKQVAVYYLKTGKIYWGPKPAKYGFSCTSAKGQQIFYITPDEKYLIMGNDRGLRLYNMHGEFQWDLQLHNNPCDGAITYPIFFGGNSILFSDNHRIKLYRGF